MSALMRVLLRGAIDWNTEDCRARRRLLCLETFFYALYVRVPSLARIVRMSSSCLGEAEFDRF